MCGFVCVIAAPGRFDSADLSRSIGALHHRGPDAQAVEKLEVSAEREIWFAHARLAIVDLSDAGRQPMHVAAGDREGAIVFNGEIYNHRSLRPEIASRVALHSTSDTEVLLAGLLLHGPEFLKRANAMFAFALFDRTSRSLLVARDRLGKKPLYVYAAHGVVAFASELKAFHALGLPLTIDRESMAYYRWLGYVPAERSIYRECRKFPAASFAELDLRRPDLRIEPQLFWDPLAAMGERYTGSYDDAIAELSTLLDDATRIRLEADVPVGIFLSGGIDSSLVAACTSRDRVARAYIIKPLDAAIDESPVALRTAERLGLTAKALSLGASDYDAQLGSLGWFYDEPMADLSQLAVMANAEQARRDVVVVLTGDGGDEVFLGYPWFSHPDRALRMRRLAARVPGARVLGRRLLRSDFGVSAMRLAAKALGLNAANAQIKAQIAATALSDGDVSELHEFFVVNRLRADLDPEDREIIGGASLLEHVKRWQPRYDWAAASSRSVPELLGALDLVSYMRDAILVKVDRGTMAHSVEARSPLLDHRVVELGMRIPLSYKVQGTQYKRILRDLCARAVGEDVSRLRKQGFAIVTPSNVAEESRISHWNTVVEGLWRGQWASNRRPTAGNQPISEMSR